MSVIGRLDGQVDEIIIKPVAARNRPETDEQSSSEESATQTEGGAVKDQAPDAEERPEEQPEDLPVWLL